MKISVGDLKRIIKEEASQATPGTAGQNITNTSTTARVEKFFDTSAAKNIVSKINSPKELAAAMQELIDAAAAQGKPMTQDMITKAVGLLKVATTKAAASK